MVDGIVFLRTLALESAREIARHYSVEVDGQVKKFEMVF